MPEHAGDWPGGEASAITYAMIEHAFDLWRSATAYLARIPSSERRATYEAAISLGLASLQRHDSMHALLAAYYAPYDAETTDWIELACRRCQGDYILNRGIVEDVAYVRRAQQLITEATGEIS
jgi:hypothetical protein